MNGSDVCIVPEGTMPFATIVLQTFLDEEGEQHIAVKFHGGNEVQYLGMLQMAAAHIFHSIKMEEWRKPNGEGV